jgi:hypothetical protein
MLERLGYCAMFPFVEKRVECLDGFSAVHADERLSVAHVDSWLQWVMEMMDMMTAASNG